MTNHFTRRAFLKLASVAGLAACGDTEEPIAAPDGSEGPSPSPAPEIPGAGSTPPGGEGGSSPPPPVPGIDLDAVSQDKIAFPYGVMAGDATPSAAMLWTKHVGMESLFVQVEELATKKVVVSRAVAAGEKSAAGFVHVDATGLTAGTKYRYAFYAVDGAGAPKARGPIGRVRAALAPGALEVVTFGGTSCTHQNGAPYPELADAAKRDFDFFVHGGDHVYTDAGADAVTLAQYRAKYGTAWGQAGMSALHGSTGMVLTWDDHEFLNNWNPETIATARLDAALQSFFEHRALRRDPTAKNRVWRSFQWGDTLEMIVLDARSERKPSTRLGANAEFISPAQMTWLKSRLKASTAVFKFVLTSVPITNFPPSAAGEADKWEGYPAQREEILDFVEKEKLTGVWWLSGDLHFASIGGIAPSGPRLAMKEVLMGPGGTNARTGITLSATQFEKVIEEKNYTSFRVDPTKKQVTITYLGANGKKIFEKTYPA